MDPISILSLAASTTTATYTVATALYQFINALKSVDSEIEALAGEVTSLRRVLDAINVTITNNPILMGEKAMAPENTPIWAAVAGSLNDCRVTVERLALTLPKQGPSGKRNFLRQTIKVFKYNNSTDDVQNNRAHVNTHVNSLQLSLQMVSILAASLTPYAAVESVAASVDSLTQALSRYNIIESNLAAADSSTEGYAPHSQQVGKLASRILSNPGSLLTSGILESFSKQDQVVYKGVLDEVFSDFNKSIFDADVDDSSTIVASDTEDDSDSENETEVELISILFGKGNEKFKQGQYAEAGQYFRDGLGHLDSISKGVEKLQLDDIRLKLALICQRQEKWQEAELMLTMLAKVSPGRRMNSKTLEASHLLAQTFLCQYDFASALECCQQALAGRRKFLGKTHPSYYSSLRLLSLIHESNGDSISASMYLKKIPAGAGFEQAEAANSIAIERFAGYSADENLRMTLAEKKAALERLAEGDFLSRNRPGGQNGPPGRTNVFSEPILFKVGADSLNLGSALHWAAPLGHELVVRWCLARGADPNSDSQGTTVLIQAAAEGQESVVRTLLKAGADVNMTDRNERCSLLWASLWGHESTVKTLLEFGALVDIPESDGSTALLDAAVKGHDSIVRLLLAHGANIEAKTSRQTTALLRAVDRQNSEVFHSLLDHGASVNVKNDQGEYPLHLAASARNHGFIQALVEKGADVNAKTPSGETALMRIIPSGKVATLEYLLAHGADVNAQAEDGETALTKAVDWDSATALLRVLLANGADMHHKCDKRNAYQTAKMRQNRNCLAILEEFNAPKE